MKTKHAKEKFSENLSHNILRLVDVLPNSPFTSRETVGVYYF